MNYVQQLMMATEIEIKVFDDSHRTVAQYRLSNPGLYEEVDMDTEGLFE